MLNNLRNNVGRLAIDHRILRYFIRRGWNLWMHPHGCTIPGSFMAVVYNWSLDSAQRDAYRCTCPLFFTFLGDFVEGISVWNGGGCYGCHDNVTRTSISCFFRAFLVGPPHLSSKYLDVLVSPFLPRIFGFYSTINHQLIRWYLFTSRSRN